MSFSFLKKKKKNNQYKAIDNTVNASCLVHPSVHYFESMKSQPLTATWSNQVSNSVGPSPRSSHFTIHFDKLSKVCIGYGIDKKNQILNDVWIFDLITLKWTLVNFEISPRTGTKAISIGNLIFAFGGFVNKTYMADFHILNLENGQIIFLNNEDEPKGRVGHVMAEFNGEILIWGGFDGEYLNDCWVYNCQFKQWTQVESDIPGRVSASFCQNQNFVYIFGGGKRLPLVQFNFLTKKFTIFPLSDEDPENSVIGGGMISVLNYLIVIGKSTSRQKNSLLFGYDLYKKKWFNLPVIPDSITTNFQDGEFDDKGQFHVPFFPHSSMVYDSPTRKIFIFLGEPKVDPISIQTVDLKEALGFLNLQHDLLDLF